MIYDTPLAGARVRQPIRVTHSGEEGLMQWSQLRSVFFICFNEGTHRKTGVSDAWCARGRRRPWLPVVARRRSEQLRSHS